MNWSTALDSYSTSAHELEIALRLLVAALASAAIGYERETMGRDAGLRTHMLTALASAMFTILTFEIYIAHGKAGDPVRIIEAVTAGVAFLAAGAIIQSRGEVRGLTTGAAMWMAGALGVACGAGFYVLAVIATVSTLFVLRALKWLQATLDGEKPIDGPGPAKNGSGRDAVS